MLSLTLEAGLSPGTANSAAVDVADRAPDRFGATIAEGLHALAQPLTILRSTVALLASPDTPEAGRRRYLDLSAEQVQRACDLFEAMQDVVITNQVEAARAPFPISKLIATATDDANAGLNLSSVQIDVVAPGDLPPVLGDSARTLQALTAALKVALSLSEAVDTVEVLAMPRAGFVCLAVNNARAHGRTLNSSQRLRLALAEANIRSQRGTFTFSEDPFCVLMELPFAG